MRTPKIMPRRGFYRHKRDAGKDIPFDKFAVVNLRNLAARCFPRVRTIITALKQGDTVAEKPECFRSVCGLINVCGNVDFIQRDSDPECDGYLLIQLYIERPEAGINRIPINCRKQVEGYWCLLFCLLRRMQLLVFKEKDIILFGDRVVPYVDSIFVAHRLTKKIMEMDRVPFVEMLDLIRVTDDDVGLLEKDQFVEEWGLVLSDENCAE